MVMEPNQQVDGSQNKIDYPQDISMEFQQQNAHIDNNAGQKGPLKADNSDSKNFPPNSNGPDADQFKTVAQSRPFPSGYNEGGLQRSSSMYGEGMMPQAMEQTHYPQTGTMPSSNNSTSLAANTPTLNQLLTQNPTPQKYPPGYGDYSNTNSGAPGGAQSMYDGWNSSQQQTSMTANAARPGMPIPSRPMGANAAQMAYDRSAMHQNYRHPAPPFGPAGASGYPRMMAPHQGYPGMEGSQGGSSDGAEMDAATAQQRMRPMMAPQRMMGPPRAPGPHQMEPGVGGQMMPPPNQSQGLSGMYPYGSQPYRNAQMSPYANYPANQMGPQLNRSNSQPGGGGFIQGPINAQHQVNGPSHKSIPQSPGQSLSQPLNQPSPGASNMRGISPAPNQQANLAASPAGSTAGQAKNLSPCPSPSVRSMPPSPAAAAQLSSPHPGLSPRPESVSSPRTDSSSVKAETIATPVSSAVQNVNQALSNSTNQSEPSQSHLKAELQQPTALHGSQSQPHPHMMPPQQQQQMRMQHQSAPTMGNGMPPYAQRMPGPGQPPGQYQQPGGQFPPGAAGPQYPPNHNQQMGYAAGGSGAPQGSWPPGQQMPPSSDVPRMPNPGAMYPMKNEKGPVPSPLSATQSPSAVASPHGSEGSRRPSSRKSSDAGSHGKSQKPVAPNTVHGTSMDIVNRQVDMGPANEAPARRQFMDHLCAFYLDTSKPIGTMPSIGKNPLDLYKVYTLVKEKGGFQQVCKKKLWKLVCSSVAVSTAANAAYTLKKAYMKFLLNYECKFELGGADPQAIINSVDTKKDRSSRNAPSPAGSGNSQDAHMRGFPEYPMGPSGPPSQMHPAHMATGGQMRPGQYHHDPNMPPHQQQHGYMNYNNMAGAPPGGLPNGHHPMPPHQPGSMPPDDQQQQMPSQSDPNADPYHQQMNSGQYNNQQQMSAPGYPPRHTYYGPRMPPPGAQRPPFHPQQSTGPGPQQPGGLPGSQMRMGHPSQSGYPPMYRDSNNSYPSSQSGGMGPTSSTNPGGFPTMGSQANMTSSSSPYPQSSVAGANQSQISASANNMVQPSMHPSPATPMPRYPLHRQSFQTPTRGALSAMLSNSAAAADARVGAGQHWRQRAPMPPPGYSQGPPNEPMSRRQLPMSRQGPTPKKEVVFPPGSVEATQMNKVQRRVLHSKHIGKVETAKLVMCLRSGLICESVWALDSITIYLQDDSAGAYFTLAKMPALFDAIIAHYKQSLALMFEELADLVESDSARSPRSTHSSGDSHSVEEEQTTDTILDGDNYSWSARNGLKVMIDEEEPKKGQTIPTPSMYSQRTYTNNRTDLSVVATYEPKGDLSEMYTKHFRYSVPQDSLCTNNCSMSPVNSLNEDNQCRADFLASASSEAGGSEPTGKQSLLLEKRELLEEYAACNGCVSFGVKGEAVSEHSCESSDTVFSKANDTHMDIEAESAIDRKVAESSEDLKALEAKLSHSRKRRFSETIDVEPIVRDEPPLESDVDMKLEEISMRCLTLANILRGFSFIPTNEKVMAETTELLYIMGRLLNVKTQVDGAQQKRCWWWPALESLREHTLVTLSNIAGYIQLIGVAHEICFPLLDSLLFWSTTNAAYARDPLPGSHSLCIRNLVMEILCKMCAHCDNMNLLLYTPPHERITSLFHCLAKLLAEPDQVRREFALVTVSCLAQADAAAARGLAMQTSCVSQLISILESAESAALSIAQQRGVSALRDKPEAMGTSLDMIRRTSATLVEMAQVEANHGILLRQQDRLLNLVMSQILDQHVAKMLSDVLYECTKNSQMHIAPSYVISAELPPEVERDEPEQEESVEEEPMERVVETDCKGALKMKDECQLGKENINKPSLETNNTMGMISAAS